MSTTSVVARDIFDVLVREHRDLQALLWDVDWVTSRGEEDTAAELFEELAACLLAHVSVEERMVYRRLEAAGSMPAATLTRARASHASIEQRIRELRTLGTSAIAWRDTLRDLRDLLDRHVRQDEHELFPVASTILAPGEALQLGATIRRIEGEGLVSADAA